MRLRFLLLVLLASSPAWARSADGTLDLIRTPNSGVPALVASGGTIEADLAAKGDLQLIAADGTARPLPAEWTEKPGGRFQATCTVAADFAPGAYTLAVTAGGRTDTNDRSVYVFASFPDSYPVAHVTDTHVGRAGADETFRATLKRVNESKAAFVLITGDLTDSGTPEQFQLFLECLKTCTVPTFVCAGNHDRKELNYEHFFGPDVYMFRFGPDGYLVFDTKDAIVGSDLGEQDAALYRYRRELRSCRWSVGATHRYETGMGMRAQLTLFIDDPLDLLLAGHRHEAFDGSVPWGTTSLVLTPASVNGALRILLFSDRIIRNAGGLPEAP